MTKDFTFEKISESHLFYMKLTALIPFEDRDLNFIGTQLLAVYFHVINIIYNTMFSGYGVRMAARKGFEVDYICEMLVVESVCFRYLTIFLNRHKLIKLMQKCRELWSFLTEEEVKVVRSFERKAHYFRLFMLMNSLAVVTLFIATAHFVRLPPATVNGTERKRLPFRFYVEVYDEPTFTIVLLLQAVVTYTIPITIAGIETCGLYFIMMACGFLRSMQSRLLSLKQIESHQEAETSSEQKKPDGRGNYQVVYKELLVCVKFHQKIMQFCEELEHFTRYVFFITVFTTIYNMSLTGIKLLENDEEKFKYAAILILNLFQFFTCQWAPEFLLIESEAVGNAAYFASFQKSVQDGTTNKLLLFIMMRAQRPIQLTAGGYINLSIETFGSMVKSAFSFFAVLRSFND